MNLALYPRHFETGQPMNHGRWDAGYEFGVLNKTRLFAMTGACDGGEKTIETIDIRDESGGWTVTGATLEQELKKYE